MSKTFTAKELKSISGIEDVEAAKAALEGKRVLLLGAGDLARKKETWVKLLHHLGIEVYVADVKEKPTGLDVLAPFIKDFIVFDGGAADRHLVGLGKEENFALLDISTWGDSHLAMALRFQDIVHLIVDTKPVDTHLDFLKTVYRYNIAGIPLFRRLVENLLVHDHYGGRWVVREAARLMPTWHSTEGFVNEVEIYILESNSVNREALRIDALKEGICLDLMPHAFRVLQALLPIGASWRTQDTNYRRTGLKISLSGGAREKNIGCPIPGHVETFTAVSLDCKDTVEINGGFARTEEFPFKCLFVVGKGVSASQGDERDTKGVSVEFQTGRRLNFDLESQRIKPPTGGIILPPADILHRGINLPLIELLKTGLTQDQLVAGYFQPFDQAFEASMLIAKSMQLPWLGRSYEERTACTSLINSIPRSWWGPLEWQLQSITHVQIGATTPGTTIIP